MSAARNDERWFILPMQSWPEESRRTVLAGKPIGANRLMAVFDTPEEAREAVDAHNARLDTSGPVADAIEAHLALVVANEALFNDEGDLLVTADEAKVSEAACNDAFRAVLAVPCASIEDVRAKVDYVLNGTVGERTPIHTDLTGFEEWSDTYAEDGNLMTFLRSLSSAAAPAATTNDRISRNVDRLKAETLAAAMMPVGVEILDLDDLVEESQLAADMSVAAAQQNVRSIMEMIAADPAGRLTFTAAGASDLVTHLRWALEQAELAHSAALNVAAARLQGVR